MLDNLTRANRESRDSRDRDGGPTPKVLELDVDCTDPYGRYEIDADGHGGAPTLIGDDDSINGGDTGGGGAGAAADAKNEATPKVPVRNATVFVSTAPIISSQPTVVLSAAVSSLERIEKDRNTALLQSVYFRQEDIECPYTAPELWRTSEVDITISFIAWAIILLGYLAPFCLVAAIITHNGYSPSMNTNGTDDEGGSGNFGLFSAVYSANGAPPRTIDQMREVSFEDFREDYPKECCVSYSLQHSNMGPIVCIINISFVSFCLTLLSF